MHNCFALFLFAFLLSSRAAVTPREFVARAAASATDSCANIDVVLVIDDSGSISDADMASFRCDARAVVWACCRRGVFVVFCFHWTGHVDFVCAPSNLQAVRVGYCVQSAVNGRDALGTRWPCDVLEHGLAAAGAVQFAVDRASDRQWV